MEDSTGDTSSTLNAVNELQLSTQTLNTPPRGTGELKKTKSKSKPLYFWTSGDVDKWLKKHGGRCYELYAQLLIDNDVTGRTLILLNDMKLEKLGVKKAEHRKEIMQHVLRLRLKHDLTAIKSLDQKHTVTGFEIKLPDPKKT